LNRRWSIAAFAIRSVIGTFQAQKNGRAARAIFRWSLGGGSQCAAIDVQLQIFLGSFNPR
jgi:hypothetical protein